MSSPALTTASTRYGKVCVYSNDNPIAMALIEYGEWAEVEIRFLTQFVRPGSTVIDGGCHIGLHSLGFLSKEPTLRVLAFEPQPSIRALAERNIQTAFGSKQERWQVFGCALGSGLRRAYIPQHKFEKPINAGATSILPEPTTESIAIEVRSLDSFSLTNISLIKLDIEGSEPPAILGAWATIAKNKPVIFCELNNLQIGKHCMELLAKLGYLTYFCAFPAFNPENYAKNSRNVFDEKRETGLLFVPEQITPDTVGLLAFTQVLHHAQLEPLLEAAPTAGTQHAPTQAVPTSASRRRSWPIEARRRWRQFRLRDHAFSQILLVLSQGRTGRTCREIVLSGLFDREWYLKIYPDVRESGINPVVHYVLVGAREGRNPNPYFDTHYYLRTNPDVHSSGLNPLIHYIRHGERENRKPSPFFDPAKYKRSHPQLQGRQSKYRSLALRHFLASGAPNQKTEPPRIKQTPSIDEFSVIAQSNRRPSCEGRAPIVDVIVPVYKGYQETFACLLSVLQSTNETPFELIVINDCSPEAEITKDLRRLSDMGLITLLENCENMGFVGTANRGMRLHPSRDVLLLNSDAFVYNNWLDRLRSHALSTNAGTVTPFTNNGTICSYPRFCRDNAPPDDPGNLDQLFSTLLRGHTIDVPTGVGFCMYVRRAALEHVGYLDEEAFGKGYGEENDLCVRLEQAGFRNLHALDTFVSHAGETSFGHSARRRQESALRVLTRKHPRYLDKVSDHVRRDPAYYGRVAADIARLLGSRPEKLTVVFSHNWGGGIDRYLNDRIRAATRTGENLLVFSPAEPGTVKLALHSIHDERVRECGDLPNLKGLNLEENLAMLGLALTRFSLETIEIHSTVGWAVALLDVVRELGDMTGAGYLYYAHDYLPLCPQINLVDYSGRYCREPGIEACNKCMTSKPGARHIHPEKGCPQDIESWRKLYAGFLEHARNVIAPSHDTSARYQRHFPRLQVNVIPHTSSNRVCLVGAAPPRRRYLIASLGALGQHKGSHVLLACAKYALAHEVPMDFVVIGYTDIDKDLQKLANVRITGRYTESELGEILQSTRPDLIFLPSIWPETYCYTLSSAMEAGLPVAVFDIGAQAERTMQYTKAIRIPLADQDSPASIVLHLARCVDQMRGRVSLGIIGS